jgi:hypothetical protein
MKLKLNKEILSTVFTFLIIAVSTYFFLALCNWNLSIKEWTGFSRFILGAEGVIFILYLTFNEQW